MRSADGLDARCVPPQTMYMILIYFAYLSQDHLRRKSKALAGEVSAARRPALL
jgi:hypothetical protein